MPTLMPTMPPSVRNSNFLGKDDGTVGKGIGIHDGQTFVKILDPLDEGNRAKDLTVAHAHARFDMVEDSGADKEAIFIAGNNNVAAIQDQLRTLVDAGLDPFADVGLVLGRYDGTKLGGGIIGTTYGELLGLFLEHGHKAVCDALLNHDHGKGHAAHARAAVGRVDNGVMLALYE